MRSEDKGPGEGGGEEDERRAWTPGRTAERRRTSDWKNWVVFVVRRIMRASG